MTRTEIEVLLNQDDVLFLEIFRRAKIQMTVESITNDNNASKESSSPNKFVDQSRNSLTHFISKPDENNRESTKKKHLATRNEEVGLI